MGRFVPATSTASTGCAYAKSSVYNTPGSYSFTVPTGVTSIRMRAIGGGLAPCAGISSEGVIICAPLFFDSCCNTTTGVGSTTLSTTQICTGTCACSLCWMSAACALAVAPVLISQTNCYIDTGASGAFSEGVFTVTPGASICVIVGACGSPSCICSFICAGAPCRVTCSRTCQFTDNFLAVGVSRSCVRCSLSPCCNVTKLTHDPVCMFYFPSSTSECIIQAAASGGNIVNKSGSVPCQYTFQRAICKATGLVCCHDTGYGISFGYQTPCYTKVNGFICKCDLNSTLSTSSCFAMGLTAKQTLASNCTCMVCDVAFYMPNIRLRRCNEGCCQWTNIDSEVFLLLGTPTVNLTAVPGNCNADGSQNYISNTCSSVHLAQTLCCVRPYVPLDLFACAANVTPAGTITPGVCNCILVPCDYLVTGYFCYAPCRNLGGISRLCNYVPSIATFTSCWDATNIAHCTGYVPAPRMVLQVTCAACVTAGSIDWAISCCALYSAAIHANKPIFYDVSMLCCSIAGCNVFCSCAAANFHYTNYVFGGFSTEETRAVCYACCCVDTIICAASYTCDAVCSAGKANAYMVTDNIGTKSPVTYCATSTTVDNSLLRSWGTTTDVFGNQSYGSLGQPGLVVLEY